jgi:hypothetical protein
VGGVEGTRRCNQQQRQQQQQHDVDMGMCVHGAGANTQHQQLGNHTTPCASCSPDAAVVL